MGHRNDIAIIHRSKCTVILAAESVIARNHIKIVRNKRRHFVCGIVIWRCFKRNIWILSEMDDRAHNIIFLSSPGVFQASQIMFTRWECGFTWFLAQSYYLVNLWNVILIIRFNLLDEPLFNTFYGRIVFALLALIPYTLSFLNKHFLSCYFILASSISTGLRRNRIIFKILVISVLSFVDFFQCI